MAARLERAAEVHCLFKPRTAGFLLERALGWSDGGETLFFDALLECAEAALKAAADEGGDSLELRIPGAGGG